MTTNKPEPVAWMTHHDEPMLFPSKSEAATYCGDGEEPAALVRLSDYEALQAECEKLRAESQRLIEVLSDYYSQNKCGCGHPACKRCLDDRFVEDVLADTHAGAVIRAGGGEP